MAGRRTNGSTGASPVVWAPHERPTLPGSPATPHHPSTRRLAYSAIGVLLGISGGLGTAFISINLASLQGNLGVDARQAAWLPVVYVMTNVSANLLLVKFRQQFGLRLFTRTFLGLYAVSVIGHLFAESFASAIAVRAIAGIAGAAVSSHAMYYMIQGFPAKYRLKALAVGIGLSVLATPIAGLISSHLLDVGSWRTLYMFEAGLSLCALGGVLLLPLPPSEHHRVFERLDLLTFALLAPALALFAAVVGLGTAYWWLEAPWLGYALAASIVLGTSALMLEHNRTRPLLDIRWLTGADMLRFAVTALLIRLVMAEQNSGALGMMRVLGLLPEQMHGLYMVLLLATLAGIVCSALLISPTRTGWLALTAVLLIAAASFLDAHATSLTRPPQLYFSQGLLSFAGALFVAPMLLSGMFQVLRQGAQYLVSFIVVFNITQSMGGLLGSALVGTFQIVREKFHGNELASMVDPANAIDAARLQQLGAPYRSTLGDPAMLQAQGPTAMARIITREANVLAYNDSFLVIGILAMLLAAWIGYRLYRSHRTARLANANTSNA